MEGSKEDIIAYQYHVTFIFLVFLSSPKNWILVLYEDILIEPYQAFHLAGNDTQHYQTLSNVPLQLFLTFRQILCHLEYMIQKVPIQNRYATYFI